MRILAIESSAVTASVAILTDDTLTAEYTINYKKTHSQTLLPMIDEICDMTDVKPDEFDVVAVSLYRVLYRVKDRRCNRKGHYTCHRY